MNNLTISYTPPLFITMSTVFDFKDEVGKIWASVVVSKDIKSSGEYNFSTYFVEFDNRHIHNKPYWISVPRTIREGHLYDDIDRQLLAENITLEVSVYLRKRIPVWFEMSHQALRLKDDWLDDFNKIFSMILRET